MRKLAIAVCYYYSEREYLQDDACIPLQLGYDETHVDMGIQKDNEGDNRGDKHPYYSEYSGIYWLWKNVEAEYKGMFQHRRAFTIEKESIWQRLYNSYRLFRGVMANLLHYKEIFTLHQIKVSKQLYKSKIDELLVTLDADYVNKYDIIVPVPVEMWPLSVKKYFSVALENKMFQYLEMAIEAKCPEFLPYWHMTLDGRTLYYSNMSIMKNHLYDAYCTVVFGVFDQLEEFLIKDKYYISLSEERAISRKFGYVGELLTNTYVLYQLDHNAKVKELNVVVNTESRGWNGTC